MLGAVFDVDNGRLVDVNAKCEDVTLNQWSSSIAAAHLGLELGLRKTVKRQGGVSTSVCNFKT